MEKLNIKIIGLGGVGTYLCSAICRYLNYSKVEARITFIDGDSYEVKNLERQIFSNLGNKARVKCDDMRSNYSNLKFMYASEYINSQNVSIHINDKDIVFICVDNHITRKIISDFVCTLDNITVISGGNEFIDGNVQVFDKKGGVNISPSLTDYHPEIESPGDQSPEEMTCEELSRSAPQLLFTNITVAIIMCWIFYSIIMKKKNAAGCAEIYFDIVSMSVRPQHRVPINNLKGDQSYE